MRKLCQLLWGPTFQRASCHMVPNTNHNAASSRPRMMRRVNSAVSACASWWYKFNGDNDKFNAKFCFRRHRTGSWSNNPTLKLSIIQWLPVHTTKDSYIPSKRLTLFLVTSRLAIKQAGLTACLACLIGNQASQQAEGPDLGKPASQKRTCLLACLPAW